MKLIKKILFLLLMGFVLSCTPSSIEDFEEDLIQQRNDDNDDDEDDDEDEITKHHSLFFVRLDPNIDDDEVEDLLDDLNSVELWFREEINLRLWNTTTFPYTDSQGEQVTNIDGQIARARTRTRVSDATFNVGGLVNNPLESQDLYCFEETIDLSAPGDAEIMISIFDTGIENGAIPDYSGYDYIDDDEAPEDNNGHGTQVASLIHQLVNQNRLAENIEFDIRKTHDGQGLGYASAIIPAILDAVDEGANILNFSFSYQDVNDDSSDRPMQLAVDYAEENGVLILAAAGNISKDNDNDAIISFPASYPSANIISNAALSCENKLSKFSSYGRNSVDLAFLGENIPVEGLNGANLDQSGTSFSTACITAMAAIMATHQENMDMAAIKCALINTSDYSDDLRELIVSQGIVNFQAALENMEICN